MTAPAQRAAQFLAANARGDVLATPPSAEDPAFDLDAAYRVQAECARLRRADGHATTGYKVGFANKALWRVLKLETLVWAHMYDDTVHMAADGGSTWSVERLRAPKIEPEIVFKLKRPIVEGDSDAASVLDAVEWMALGFEIVDCPFPDWRFQAVDFVAALGFHAALVVGEPLPVTPERIPALVEALPRFTLQLSQNGAVVEQGSGKNSLRSPALCLAELAAAIARRPGAEPLEAGDLVSTGSLTEARLIGRGETWTAAVDGLDLRDLTLRVQ